MTERNYNGGRNTVDWPGGTWWVLRPVWLVSVLSSVGTVLLSAGVYLIVNSSSLVECGIEYSDSPVECGAGCEQILSITRDHCSGNIGSHRQLTEDPTTGELIFRDVDYIKGPIFTYYRLDGFGQNLSTFRSSRVLAQLKGNSITDRNRLSLCEPAVSAPNNYLILTPCGIAARSVFNDTFVPFKYCQTGVRDCKIYYNYRQRVQDILWPNDEEYLFKNPSGNLTVFLDEWLDEEIFPGRMENAHFQVWMRDSALPNFLKAYGVIDDDVDLPLHIQVTNRYPITSYGGHKYFIITQLSYLGGRSAFLGTLYSVVGAIIILLAIIPAIIKIVKA
ncbi:LEM3/CDC50 family protein [Gregarina niphandrodes]|uniref:LEM3/CDC50 family protein n=1 Tax=Gregarina niphandrodes TaxID=110365 RepID=A0A023B906_GRENI|nr:LEM3/CDC50 family protein [Gregarina niphandrodes]EZG70682.1 LEM3/CDC50 family protein [Gregarina niphandrodes]|eukprot:XP_011129902.1 LEM3/CDC50 family protein [Gregarina niphandrodes]